MRSAMAGALLGVAASGEPAVVESLKQSILITDQSDTRRNLDVKAGVQNSDLNPLMLDTSNPQRAMSMMQEFIEEYGRNMCQYDPQCKGDFEAAQMHMVRAILLNRMAVLAGEDQGQVKELRQLQLDAIKLANQRLTEAIEKYKLKLTPDILEREAQEADADGKTDTAKTLREQARSLRQ